MPFCAAFGTAVSMRRKVTSRAPCTSRECPQRHQACGRKPSGVLTKPRKIAFRDEPVPLHGPDHGHYRGRSLGPADGLGEEEVLHPDDEVRQNRKRVFSNNRDLVFMAMSISCTNRLNK